MKTILTKKLNGLDIVIGFGRCSMDPIATRAKAEPLIASTQIQKDVNAKVVEMKAIVVSADEAMRKSRQCLSKNDQVGAETHHKEFLGFQAPHKAKEEELGLILPDLKNKVIELYEQEAIYFELEEGEFVVSPEFLEQIKVDLNSLAQNECLKFTQSETGTITTEKIPNFVGRSYFVLANSVWGKHEMTLVGESIPNGSILEADLSVVQKAEIDLQELTARIAALTPAQKAAELQVKTDELIIEAADKKLKWEIQKVTTALTDSQAWYETELSKLTALYA